MCTSDDSEPHFTLGQPHDSYSKLCTIQRPRPYRVENTRSRPITEVSQSRAWSVFEWMTAWEHHVL